jgi:hypothetical protein
MWYRRGMLRNHAAERSLGSAWSRMLQEMEAYLVRELKQATERCGAFLDDDPVERRLGDLVASQGEPSRDSAKFFQQELDRGIRQAGEVDAMVAEAERRLAQGVAGVESIRAKLKTWGVDPKGTWRKELPRLS